ncbi:septal ring lytic transglycosylase RlpA family protein [Zhongshania guokunii]|uniref:Endolytic peptidoglycan transglycosylase RlpA n=1 Tax=Zhongshania guokunii TaxID=641783 RepID=A0ABV3U237_9GAMM
MSKISNNWLALIAPQHSCAPSSLSALSIIAIFTLLLSLVACSSLPVEEAAVEEEEVVLVIEETPVIIESGLASYYGDRHHNQKTASGERYRHELKTAAHRTLPFGSHVKVTNPKTGQSVLVTINDRGPFARGRIIDLSKSAFAEIGNTASGVIKVDIQVIE